MRVMVLIKADENTESGALPDEKLVSDMMKYNEELVKAGVMLEGDGLYPSSKGRRVKFSGGKATVTDGPFTEAKELIAGYWIWQVKSLDEAVEWVKRMPNPSPGPLTPSEGNIEIRQIYEMDDFAESFTPELKAKGDKLRDQIAANAERGS